jgi:hypothetical protein
MCNQRQSADFEASRGLPAASVVPFLVVLMSYTQVRDLHYGLVPLTGRKRLERSPREAARVHAAIIRRAAEWGAGRVIRDRAAFSRAVRADLGIASWLAPWLQAALVQIVQLLLPVIIRWLESQLATASVDRTTFSVDARLQRLAQEAGQ